MFDLRGFDSLELPHYDGLIVYYFKANEGAPGVDGVSVYELKSFISKYKVKYLKEIRERKYEPAPVRGVEIPKPDGGVRKLGIPTTFDRVIQQAISQVLSSIYEEQFSKNSFGFRQIKVLFKQ
ncbi:reverse transcriptase domain-containing protein [Mycoplasmatota bacterium zrk1]